MFDETASERIQAGFKLIQALPTTLEAGWRRINALNFLMANLGALAHGSKRDSPKIPLTLRDQEG